MSFRSQNGWSSVCWHGGWRNMEKATKTGTDEFWRQQRHTLYTFGENLRIKTELQSAWKLCRWHNNTLSHFSHFVLWKQSLRFSKPARRRRERKSGEWNSVPGPWIPWTRACGDFARRHGGIQHARADFCVWCACVYKHVFCPEQFTLLMVV